MEMKENINYNGLSLNYSSGLLVVCLYIICLLAACDVSERKEVIASNVHPLRHTLLPLAPAFSIETSGDTLYHQYLRLPQKKEFPLIGIIYIDGKGYRFMGSDSLRIQALAPLAGDSCGWTGKYSFLCPEDDWKEAGYNDTGWEEGRAAFGTEGLWYVTNTFWDVNNIFVRRRVKLDKEMFDNRKLYIRFLCDDIATIYLNGDEVVHSDYTDQTVGCRQLPDTIVKKLREGDNLLAAHCYDIANKALLDYGMYVENKEYKDIVTAQLTSVDIQATQTHYKFQCGEVELQLSFVSPALLQNKYFMGCPAGFLSYQVVSKNGQQHNVEILFDLDMEWMFDRIKVKESVEKGWKIIQGDSLYIAMKSDDDIQSVCKDGRIVLTQKNMMRNGKDNGVLLLGYKEGEVLQYFGENLPCYWEKGKKVGIKDALRNMGNEYQSLQRECDEVDSYYLRKLSLEESSIKADKMLPFYRNFMSTRRISVAPDGELLCYGNIVGRVRDAFGSFPYLLFYERVDWMKGLLKPVFDCCESGHWPKQFPPFDIGFFPIAIHQESVNDYAIEMASDMMMMTLAVVKAEKSFDYAERHWNAVSQWGNFLANVVVKQQEIAVEKQKDSVALKKATVERQEVAQQIPSANKEEVKSVLGLIAYQELIDLQRRSNE